MGSPKFSIGDKPVLECQFEDRTSGTFLDLTGLTQASSHLCLIAPDENKFKTTVDDATISISNPATDGILTLDTSSVTGFTNGFDEEGAWRISFKLVWDDGSTLLSNDETAFSLEVVAAIGCV